MTVCNWGRGVAGYNLEVGKSSSGKTAKAKRFESDQATQQGNCGAEGKGLFGLELDKSAGSVTI